LLMYRNRALSESGHRVSSTRCGTWYWRLITEKHEL
jgi:hypothetical protein